MKHNFESQLRIEFEKIKVLAFPNTTIVALLYDYN